MLFENWSRMIHRQFAENVRLPCVIRKRIKRPNFGLNLHYFMMGSADGTWRPSALPLILMRKPVLMLGSRKLTAIGIPLLAET